MLPFGLVLRTFKKHLYPTTLIEIGVSYLKRSIVFQETIYLANLQNNMQFCVFAGVNLVAILSASSSLNSIALFLRVYLRRSVWCSFDHGSVSHPNDFPEYIISGSEGQSLSSESDMRDPVLSRFSIDKA